MKVLVIFFLATLVGCYGYEECLQERAENCLDKLLASLVDDSSESEVCRELGNSVECLESSIDACPGSEEDDDVKEGMSDLRKLLRENCEAGEASSENEEEIKKCFEANEDYIFECMFEGTAKAMKALEDDENIDENRLQCNLYGQLADCFVDRIEEKCGAEAANMATEELSDLPDEIKQACEAAAGVEILPEFRLLDEDRRKKK